MKYIDLIISGIIIIGLFFVSAFVLNNLSAVDHVNSYMAVSAIAALSYILGMGFFLACMSAKVINQHITRRGKDIDKVIEEIRGINETH